MVTTRRSTRSSPPPKRKAPSTSTKKSTKRTKTSVSKSKSKSKSPVPPPASGASGSSSVEGVGVGVGQGCPATLEKGTVYFFFRAKVDSADPSSLSDVQRSYIVLRPKGKGEGEGKDNGGNRLLVVPKKKFPGSGERFLCFVETSGGGDEGSEDVEVYLRGGSYTTKTKGERHIHTAKPIAEGVYALIKSPKGRTSHLAYILTLPPHGPSDLQHEFGLKQKGSFVVTVKNPTATSNTRGPIQSPAKFPKEIMDEFGGRRWAPLQPKHLDYKNAEVLLVGEKGGPPRQGGDEEEAAQELEALEEADLERVDHLGGDDAVFEDLDLDRREFEGISSTW